MNSNLPEQCPKTDYYYIDAFCRTQKPNPKGENLFLGLPYLVNKYPLHFTYNVLKELKEIFASEMEQLNTSLLVMDSQGRDRILKVGVPFNLEKFSSVQFYEKRKISGCCTNFALWHFSSLKNLKRAKYILVSPN